MLLEDNNIDGSNGRLGIIYGRQTMVGQRRIINERLGIISVLEIGGKTIVRVRGEF